MEEITFYMSTTRRLGQARILKLEQILEMICLLTILSIKILMSKCMGKTPEMPFLTDLKVNPLLPRIYMVIARQ